MPDSRTAGSRNIREVRYSAIQTNVRMTVLNGCIAQSHIAHDTTCLRVAGGPTWSRPKAVSAAVLIGVPAAEAGCSSLMLAVWRGAVNDRWRRAVPRGHRAGAGTTVRMQADPMPAGGDAVET